MEIEWLIFYVIKPLKSGSNLDYQIHELIDVEENSYDWIETETKREKLVVERRIKIGKVIKELLEAYRIK